MGQVGRDSGGYAFDEWWSTKEVPVKLGSNDEYFSFSACENSMIGGQTTFMKFLPSTKGNTRL